MVRLNVEELANGKYGIIVSIDGGVTMMTRLNSMNIRIGKRIKKISSQPFRGPVVIDVDGRQYALGRGMAKKIIVDER